MKYPIIFRIAANTVSIHRHMKCTPEAFLTSGVQIPFLPRP